MRLHCQPQMEDRQLTASFPLTHLDSGMRTAEFVQEFEKYRLTVGAFDGGTLQLVSDVSSGVNVWQTWRRKRKLGQGQFGEVWQEVWEDDHGDSHYRAVKTYSKAKMRAASIDHQRELSALAAFSRSKFASWFVNLHGWWMDPSELCIAMEYIGRGDLSRYATIGIPELEIKEIAEDVLQGLAAMHEEGFTHRDIKPQNILVYQKQPEFRRWWVKIADFGISKQIIADSETALYTAVGTRPYCAPEILGYLEEYRDLSIYSSKVDMWSFGCVLFNLGSQGRLAFSDIDLTRFCDGTGCFNPKSLPIHLSTDGVSLIKALLKRDPDDRLTATEALRHPWLTTTDVNKLDHDFGSTSKAYPPHPQNFNSFLDSSSTTGTNLSSYQAPKNSTIRFTTTESTGKSTRIDLAYQTVSKKHPNYSKIIPRTTDKLADSAHDRITTLENQVSSVYLEPRNTLSPMSGFKQASYNPPRRDAGTDQPSSDRSNFDRQSHSENSSVDLRMCTGENEVELEKLQRAAKRAQKKIVKLFKQNITDVCARYENGQTPLHWAAWVGQLEVAEWLVRQGAAVLAKDEDGETPLHWAARFGQLKMAEWLIERGANIHSKDRFGSTPLHVAARTGRLKMVRGLFAQGANIFATNRFGETPLHEAASKGRLEVAKWLIENGVDVHAKDKDDVTPLHWAAEIGQLEMVQWLVSKGANITAMNGSSRTPQQLAKDHGNPLVVKWLKDKEAALGVSEQEHGHSLNIPRQKGNTSWLKSRLRNLCS